MAKPTKHTDWTEGNVDQATISVEPSVAKKEAGWLPDERPPREFMNWNFQIIDEWLKYLETTTDALALQLGNFDAVVGFGGTHADINAVMADPNIANIKNVLVTEMLAPVAVQIISEDGMNFTFKPQAGISKNGAAIALQISGERVRIINGRFINFIAGGDKAIELTAASKNCIIDGNLFFNNTASIDDLGVNNVLGSNNLVEV